MVEEASLIANLTAENRGLELRLAEAEAVLSAIRAGEVDAFVVSDHSGPRIHAMSGAEFPYKRLVESMSEGAVTVSFDGIVLYCNPRLADMLKLPIEMISGSSLRSYVVESDLSLFDALLEKGRNESSKDEISLKTSDGALVRVYLSMNSLEVNEVAGVSIVVTDLTERRRAADQLYAKEEQLRQALKMEAIGQLAGGIAHDFNNLLTAIIGYSQMLLSGLRDDDPMRFEISEIERAGNRAATLTKQLLALSRKQVLQPEVLDLNVLVGGLENMLHRLIREDICLSTHLSPVLGPVKADRGQVEQVIVNLVVNARDAIPNRGNLAIETANVTLDRVYAEEHPEVSAGQYALLSVSDDGSGMDSKTKALIFDPFFTTKEKGKGTGLGLSTVFGIVKQSGGHITVHSELGKGTTIKVFLPLTDERLAPVETRPLVRESTQGSENILLVEDEEPVRRLVMRILQTRGYSVVEASDGDEALRQYKQRQGPIHLMLTDVVMPLRSGPELAKQLSALDPAMKVLYMSGYTNTAIVHNGALDPGVAYIQKPFTPDALAKKVRDVLDA
jgi:two-component system cell cycle sensor histidine kinase/response regulator CckA